MGWFRYTHEAPEDTHHARGRAGPTIPQLVEQGTRTARGASIRSGEGVGVLSSVPSRQSVGSVEAASWLDLVRGSPSGLLNPVRKRSVK